MAAAVLAGVVLGSLIVVSLPPLSYRKDFQVEYLAAWALRDGIDPFIALSELSGRYFPEATQNFPHPNPHPPVLALVSLPLTLVPFPVVALAWLVFNIALLVWIGRQLGLATPWDIALAAWPPLWFLLQNGNFEVLILALAMLGWRQASVGRDGRAGIWLGLAAAIKLYPVLLLVPFVARRRLRVVGSAAVVIAAAQAGNVLAVGLPGSVRYYRDVLPAVSEYYARTGLNASPYGALLRVFGGAADCLPVLNAPDIILPVTITLSVVGFVALIRLEPEAAPLPMLIMLPNVWYYYVVLALPQVARLLRSETPRWITLSAAAAASLVLPLLNLLLHPVMRAVRWSQAPPAVTLLSAVQSAGILALFLLYIVTRWSERGRRNGSGEEAGSCPVGLPGVSPR